MPDTQSREAIEKHLDLIQAVITRMAQNSFLIKGWSLTVITGLTVLFVESGRQAWEPLLLLIPLGSFWMLDAYFLKQERMFRGAYSAVVKDPATVRRYDLTPAKSNESIYRIAFFSKNGRGEKQTNTIRMFHAPLAFLVVLAAAGLQWQASQRPAPPVAGSGGSSGSSQQQSIDNKPPPPKAQGKKGLQGSTGQGSTGQGGVGGAQGGAGAGAPQGGAGAGAPQGGAGAGAPPGGAAQGGAGAGAPQGGAGAGGQ